MPEVLYPWMHLAGRLLFTLVFLSTGLQHFIQREGMTRAAESRGVPAAGVVVPLTGALIVGASLALLLGWHRFIAAGLLVLFLLPTAFVMHPYWKEDDPATRVNEQAHFLKDLALVGGALMIAYYAGSPWPLSL